MTAPTFLRAPMRINPGSLSPEDKLMQAACNGQFPLTCAVVPEGADEELIGMPLVDAPALTVAGLYRILIPLMGFVSQVQVFMQADIAGGCETSGFGTLYWVRDSRDPTGWTLKTAGTGAAAMADGVLQSLELATLRGEQYAVLDFTLAADSSVKFTRAEANGL